MLNRICKEIILDTIIVILLLLLLTIIFPFLYWVTVGEPANTLLYRLMKKSKLFNT